MKSPMFLICVFYLTVFATLIAGCFCNDIGCPKDKPLPEIWETKVPYQPGDKIAFSNAQNDTITFTCTERRISNFTILPDSGAEELNCNLISDNGSSLFLGTTTNQLVFNIKINIDTLHGVTYQTPSNFPVNYDSIFIAGKLLYNIEAYSNPQDSTVFFYLQPGTGLSGFVLGGIEWALVE
jgi:hypothetical protein